MPCVGTRVRRGRDWHYGNQDSNGVGTVIGHTNLGTFKWTFVTFLCISSLSAIRILEILFGEYFFFQSNPHRLIYIKNQI